MRSLILGLLTSAILATLALAAGNVLTYTITFNGQVMSSQIIVMDDSASCDAALKSLQQFYSQFKDLTFSGACR